MAAGGPERRNAVENIVETGPPYEAHRNNSEPIAAKSVMDPPATDT